MVFAAGEGDAAVEALGSAAIISTCEQQQKVRRTDHHASRWRVVAGGPSGVQSVPDPPCGGYGGISGLSGGPAGVTASSEEAEVVDDGKPFALEAE